MAWYGLCVFKEFSNSWKSFLYVYCTSSRHQVICFENRIYKVTIEPPDVIEQITGVQLFMLFLLQIYLVQ